MQGSQMGISNLGPSSSLVLAQEIASPPPGPRLEQMSLHMGQ